MCIYIYISLYIYIYIGRRAIASTRQPCLALTRSEPPTPTPRGADLRLMIPLVMILEYSIVTLG